MALTKVTFSMIKGALSNVLDFGADPTGVADSTTAIQAAINASAGKTVYLPQGTYLTSANLTVTVSNITLVGDGSSLTTVKRANNSALETGGVKISQCSGVTIKGIAFDGNRASQTNTCTGVTFESAGGGVTGVLLEDVKAYSWGTNDNNLVTTPFAAGIALYSATDVTILRCLASNNGHYGITTFECENVTITECQSNENLRHGYGSAGTFRFVTSNNLAIDNGQQGIWYRNVENGVIANNVIRWNTTSSATNVRFGIQLKRSTVSGEEAGNNICKNISIVGNTISNVSDTLTTPGTSKGIYIQANAGSVEYAVATGNTLENCDFGFHLPNGDQLNVSHNVIIGSKNYAIWDDGTNWSVINGNSIKNSPKTAVYCRGRYASIKNNQITSTNLDATNTYYGIHYLDRTDTVISGNEINAISGSNVYLHAIYLEGAFASRILCFNNQLKNSTNVVIGKAVGFGSSGSSNRDWDNFDGTGFLPYSNKRYVGELFFGVNESVPSILSGAGSPEGVITADAGSIFLRTDGGASTSVYFKESGIGNTGWVGK
jgi:parallel beta-helix repeat protein